MSKQLKNSPTTTVDAKYHLGTSITGWGRALMLALQSLGIDGRQVFLDCGLDPDEQGKSFVRNPVAKMQHAWRIAESCIEDTSILVEKIVQHLHASSFYALGFGLYASQSIEDLCKRLCTYREVLSSSTNMWTEKANGQFKFTVEDLRPVKTHVPIDALFLFILKICRELCGSAFSPIEVHVPWPKERYSDLFGDLVNAPIVYDAEYYTLVFCVTDVEHPLPSANAQLASYQDKLCREYLHSLDEQQHLPLRVKMKIVQTLGSSNFSVDYIASSLNMSARTLQRKLHETNTNFRVLVEEARLELVEEYILNPELSATQITYMLGFLNLPSFSSSFKSWYGQSFSQARETLWKSRQAAARV